MNNAYQQTEQLLRAYQSLKLKVVIDARDIIDLTAEGQKYNTSHKTAKPEEWDADIDDAIRHKQRIRNRERSMLRTQKLVERIDNALALLSDEDYELIKNVYFDGQQASQISESQKCCVKTIARKRKRIVTELMVLFYGADALEGVGAWTLKL